MKSALFCALTGQEHLPQDMLRLVVLPEYAGDISRGDTDREEHRSKQWCVDVRGNLPGLYHWVHPNYVAFQQADCLALFEQPADVISTMIMAHLHRRTLQHLNRLRRSGGFVFGGGQIRKWWDARLRQKTARKGSSLQVDNQSELLLAATDGGSDKLWRYLAHNGRVPDFCLLNQSDLGGVFLRAKLGSLLIEPSGLQQQIAHTMGQWQRLVKPNSSDKRV